MQVRPFRATLTQQGGVAPGMRVTHQPGGYGIPDRFTSPGGYGMPVPQAQTVLRASQRVAADGTRYTTFFRGPATPPGRGIARPVDPVAGANKKKTLRQKVF